MLLAAFGVATVALALAANSDAPVDALVYNAVSFVVFGIDVDIVATTASVVVAIVALMERD